KYTNIVNTLKVRGSWGELGNQNTDNWYPVYRIIDYKQNNGGWLVNGLKPNTAAESSLVSALLGWAQTQSLNFGFDLGMLDNRFNLIFVYFQRKSIDMVGPGQVLPT
ncbi:SusC/RagA family protein, partial [Phocaeicola vulgatus]|nr:SusC/RagA family protein [Phocaeicola vulgatus]